MTPINIYFAILPNSRETFASCFSGSIDEAGIKLREIATGVEWWGANGNYYVETEIDRPCLITAQAWYMAINSGIIVEGNIPGIILGSPDPGFDACLALVGLQRWDYVAPPQPPAPPAPPNGNGT
jgi:hypothetical protein